MKRNLKNIIIAGVSASIILCGATALADPANSIFLRVDLDGAGGTTQSGFQGWNIPTPGSATLGTVYTTNFASSTWLFADSPSTPAAPGTVMVTILATNAVPGTVQTNFPSWTDEISPDGVNRGTLAGTVTNADLLNDFLLVYHATQVGYGGDWISITFSNLYPNTNYEVTVWDYDPSDNGQSGTQDQVAWGVVDPDTATGSTNFFQPAQGSDIPYLVEVVRGGPAPTKGYDYSGSIFVTTDGTGSTTVYGWEADTAYSGSQLVPVNGFAIGFATNLIQAPITNAITALAFPVPSSYGPPTVWPYFAGIGISDASYAPQSFNGTNLMGETFMPTRDFIFRNFYIACQATTNTGTYDFVLYDLGATNYFGISQFIATNTPTGAYVNLLSHPNSNPKKWWSWTPGGTNLYTNTGIIKFKLPSYADQVYLTNGHSYFLGMEFVSNTVANTPNSNDLVWERTTSGKTYASGAGFIGAPFSTSFTKLTNMQQNLVMGVDVLNPNPVITVSNYPLAASWPTVSGMLNGGKPVITSYVIDSFADYTNNPNLLDLNGGAVQMTVGPAEGVLAQSMSFYNTNTFNLGAVGVVMRGVGSSNLLFTLNIYQITNTFFTATDSVEHFPRNFQPSLDSAPLGMPIFQTNVDFYYTTNYAGLGTNDQVLILTLPSQYRLPILGTNRPYSGTNNPYGCYEVELVGDQVGENASAVGLFMVVRDSADSTWQSDLFPPSGTAVNPHFPTTNVLVEPQMLNRAYPDPETFAGGIVGTDIPRQMYLALYAAPASVTYPTNITITSVTHSGSTTVLNWTESGGSGAYTFSVYRTNLLSAARATWPAAATGLPATQLSYTNTSDTGANIYYVIHSP